MYVKYLLFLLMLVVCANVVFANDCDYEMISDCINDPECTVNDHGSGCVPVGDTHEESDFCSSFTEIADCINTPGCVVSGDGSSCVVADTEEVQRWSSIPSMEYNQVYVIDGNFQFKLSHSYDEILIDGNSVDFEKHYIGGAASHEYLTSCVEGNLIEASYNGEVGWEYSIANLNCDDAICKDSDGGDDEERAGTVIFEGNTYTDTCIDDTTLEENYCLGNQAHTKIVDCSEMNLNCYHGHCVSGSGICKDSDEGNNRYKKGIVNDGWSRERTDYCKDENILVEMSCDSYESVKEVEYNCEYGCSEGACKPFIQSNTDFSENIVKEKKALSDDCPQESCQTLGSACVDGKELISESCTWYLDENGECSKRTTTTSEWGDSCESRECSGCLIDEKKCLPIGTRIQKEESTYYCSINGEMVETKAHNLVCTNSFECETNNCQDGTCRSICEGCLVENTCLPIGYRTDSNFCDSTTIMNSFVPEDSSCTNNYECQTNLCVDSTCVSKSVLQKFFGWFKSIFGG